MIRSIDSTYFSVDLSRIGRWKYSARTSPIAHLYINVALELAHRGHVVAAASDASAAPSSFYASVFTPPVVMNDRGMYSISERRYCTDELLIRTANLVSRVHRTDCRSRAAG